MTVSLDRIDTERLSPRSRWALQHLALPKIEHDVNDAELAQRHDLKPRAVKRMLDDLFAEVRAQQRGAEMPALSAQEFETVKEQVQLHGLLYPILKDTRTGRVLDGENRLRICGELGIEPEYRLVRSKDDDDARAIALSANLARRQLDSKRIRRLAAAEIVRDPSRSDRAIGEVLGVSHKAVGRARSELVRLGVVGHRPTRVGRDGVQQTKKRKPVPEAKYRVVVYGPDERLLFDRLYLNLDELRGLDLVAQLNEREEP